MIITSALDNGSYCFHNKTLPTHFALLKTKQRLNEQDLHDIKDGVNSESEMITYRQHIY